MSCRFILLLSGEFVPPMTEDAHRHTHTCTHAHTPSMIIFLWTWRGFHLTSHAVFFSMTFESFWLEKELSWEMFSYHIECCADTNACPYTHARTHANTHTHAECMLASLGVDVTFTQFDDDRSFFNLFDNIFMRTFSGYRDPRLRTILAAADVKTRVTNVPKKVSWVNGHVGWRSFMRTLIYTQFKLWTTIQLRTGYVKNAMWWTTIINYSRCTLCQAAKFFFWTSYIHLMTFTIHRCVPSFAINASIDIRLNGLPQIHVSR